MRIHIWTIAIAGTLLIEGALTTAHADEAHECSSKTTTGRYLEVCDGFLTPAPNSPLVPAKQLATVTADAGGTFKSSDGILTVGGVVLREAVTGTEDLKPDCTGTITYAQTINGQSAPSIHVAFVVSNDGHKIDGISTDPGTVFSCHLTRIASPEERVW